MNNSLNSEIEFAPGPEHHEPNEYQDEDLDDGHYSDDGDYDNDHDYHDHPSQDTYQNEHYNEDYYSNHSDAYGPQYHHS